MLLRCIAPEWLLKEVPGTRKVVEGDFTETQWRELNAQGYNIYFLPNYPSAYEKGVSVDGSHIDVFRFVFVDMDLKAARYPDKETFLKRLHSLGITPSSIVDSGNGVHAYWEVSDLDAMGYLRLSRRFMRLLETDEAVGKIFQLMRLPYSINTKDKNELKPCQVVQASDSIYTCEELDSLLPPITRGDEEYCKQHYNKTYSVSNEAVKVDDTLPNKFPKLLRENKEVKEIWSGNVDDRSKGDYRLGHIMFASGFTKAEALSVLVNSPKALSRTPTHRIGYAQGIVEKIWVFEDSGAAQDLSESVEAILAGNDSETLKGKRFPCYRHFDGTAHGFRLGQVIGLCAGVGVGKTAVALNMFRGFVQYNPSEIHMFVSLEQPGREIAERWKKMCGDDTRLHSKVHILSNYNSDGTYRHLSLHEIQDYILAFQKRTGQKVGCVCIDHIGILKKETRNGENQGLMDVCSDMKSFAIATNTLLIMQTQTSREKAGIGDIELDKDCAYGTQHFESYVDFLVAVWQPLKRVYDKPGCPLVTAYKFCKIRFKTNGKDDVLEDVRYRLVFDGETGNFREFKQTEDKTFRYFDSIARQIRKRDRKTDEIIYTTLGDKNGDSSSNKNLEGDGPAARESA